MSVSMKSIIFALLLLTIPSNSQAKTLTKDELLKIGAKQIECTVTSVGSYNFLASGPDGKELNFNTDDGTIQFNPDKERLVVGDRVSVIYIEALSPSGSADKIHAQTVDWLEKAPRNFLSGNTSCTVTPLKYRSGRTCYVESIKQIIRFEGSPLSALEGNSFNKILQDPGDVITIKLTAVPAKIGNGYIYYADPPDK